MTLSFIYGLIVGYVLCLAVGRLGRVIEDATAWRKHLRDIKGLR